ncbi:uncharacterized protein LOC131425933 [Malaya genurostris]|uniref:uncharacterized protein LOC131425933 n=1 Tax=Malaya genurostris TaxID=325434 RepID=UPI0026F3DCA1|nr:uncharacterized protein LOC131425933 [Malaya genurostris]
MVHSNTDIPLVAKLQYLLQSLVGEARKPFESVDIEADSYAIVWDTLLKRYDNRRFLKKQLFRTLHDLPAIKKESTQELHELVDEFLRHVKALAKLNEPTEHWDTPLVNMLSYKLDPATLRAWEERSSQDDDVYFDDLVEFLYQRVRILKSVASDLLQRSQIVQAKVAGSNQIPKNNFRSKIAVSAATTENKSPTPSCIACSESHYLFQCQAFANMAINQRRELVSQRKLCWNCFRTGHPARSCGSKYTCRICRDRHHTLLHDSNLSPKGSVTSALTSSQVENKNSSILTNTANLEPTTQVSLPVQLRSHMVLLETVAINIVDDQGKVFEVRALLDSASMSNFISEKLANRLSSRQSKVEINVSGIGQSQKRLNRTVTATVRSRISSFATKLQFLIIEKPTTNLPTVPVPISAWNLPNVILADPKFYVPGKVDIILGGETYWELHTGKKISLGPGQPQLIETLFGWTVSGSVNKDTSSITTNCFLSTTDDRLESTLQKFWEMETIIDQPIHSSTERRCEEWYSATTIRNSMGRYIVRLPKTDNPEIVLGESRAIAERRFLSLERRLERDANLKTAYHLFMDEYERLGHMKRLIEPVDDSIDHYYVPHHPVFKLSSTTTKTRVVFDASCKTTSGFSLNDRLLVGPVVQHDLLTLVLRFRTHPIAIIADIEKMYRQVQIHPEDQPLQRILWRTNATDLITTYELQTVTYGTACAPYLATKTLQRLSQDEAN